MAELNASITETANSTTATARTRMNLGLHHLFAACRFSARVGQVEVENCGQAFGSFWDEILHNSLGVAVLTVAALESCANEMYFEGEVLERGLNSAAALELAEMVDRETILRKYALALSISSNKRLDEGATPTQNAKALIDLRNAVVHFRPEWFGEKSDHDKLSKKLQGKFQPSVFLPNEPIFPRAWASHSFTVWALKSTVEFIDHFHSEAGLTSTIEPFRSQLSVLSANAL